MGALRVIIESSLDGVAAVGDSVRELCLHEGLPECEARGVELGVVEALNNVIEHGYGAAAHGRIDVRVIVDDSRVEVSILDQAPVADPGTFVRPPAREFDTADRSSLPEGGFGLGVVHEVFSDVKYERDGAWNRLTLVRRRESPQ